MKQAGQHLKDAARNITPRCTIAAGRRKGRRSTAETVRSQLSDRQRRVLHHLCRGATDREIATSLFLSQRTVRREIGHLRGVFGVANRTELAAAVGALRRTAVWSGTAA